MAKNTGMEILNGKIAYREAYLKDLTVAYRAEESKYSWYFVYLTFVGLFYFDTSKKAIGALDADLFIGILSLCFLTWATIHLIISFYFFTIVVRPTENGIYNSPQEWERYEASLKSGLDESESEGMERMVGLEQITVLDRLIELYKENLGMRVGAWNRIVRQVILSLIPYLPLTITHQLFL